MQLPQGLLRARMVAGIQKFTVTNYNSFKTISSHLSPTAECRVKEQSVSGPGFSTPTGVREEVQARTLFGLN